MIISALTLLTALPLAPSLWNGFVNWDDPVFVEHNLNIRSFDLESMKWMFTTFYQGNWTPLTWLTFALDYRIGGLHPWIFHMDSLFIHLANTVVVFFLVSRLLMRILPAGEAQNQPRKYAAFLTALLFGIHPLHVEPVAWVTDRVDLLCGLFFLLSLHCYLVFVSGGKRRIAYYAASFVFFLVAMASKSMAISLPIILLLIDTWPFHRWKTRVRDVVLEKVPFFVATIIFGMLSLYARSEAKAIAGLNTVPLDFRFMNASHSVVLYLERSFIPSNLGILYPLLLKDTYSAGNVFSMILTVFLIALIFLQRKKRPYLAVSFSYYLITLAPAIGLLQVGSQAAADRYFYLPSIGPFLLFSSWLVLRAASKRSVYISVIAFFWVLLGLLAYRQVTTWKDSISLWENVMRTQQRRSTIAYISLGDAYRKAGRWNEAMPLLEHAIQLDPGAPNAYDGMGRILLEEGKYEDAEKAFMTAATADPLDVWAHCHLAIVYSAMKKENLSKEQQKIAVSIKTDDPWAHYESGSNYLKFGMDEAALTETHLAIKQSACFGEAYDQLGALLWKSGKKEDAIVAYQKAISLDPRNETFKTDYKAVVGSR